MEEACGAMGAGAMAVGCAAATKMAALRATGAPGAAPPAARAPDPGPAAGRGAHIVELGAPGPLPTLHAAMRQYSAEGAPLAARSPPAVDDSGSVGLDGASGAGAGGAAGSGAAEGAAEGAELGAESGAEEAAGPAASGSSEESTSSGDSSSSTDGGAHRFIHGSACESSAKGFAIDEDAEPLSLLRPVPLPVLRGLTLTLSLVNTVALLRVALKGSPFYFFMWMLLASACLVPGALSLRDWAKRRPERSGFLGVWIAMLVPLNIKAYCWSQWGAEGRELWMQYEFAWPSVSPCPFLAYAWTAVLLAQHLRVPLEVPRGRRQVMGYAALVWAWLLTAFFCYYKTPPEGQQPSEHFGFLRDQAATMLPVLSLLMTETLHFLETGDGTGCRALLLVPPILLVVPKELYGSDWFEQGLEEPRLEPGPGLLAALLVLVLLLHGATDSESRIQSTSPMYVPLKPKEETGLKRKVTKAKMWLRTWRGANVVYLVNGVFSLLVYSFGRGQLINNLKGTLHDAYADADGKWYTGEHIVDLTITFSACSIVAAVLNLGEDMLIGHMAFRGVISRLPFDRHFRLLTLVKATLLWLKIELLVFTCYSCKGDMSMWLLVGQIVSVLCTSILAIASTINLFGTAVKLGSFFDQYRQPWLLWTSMMVALLTMSLLNGVMMISKVVGEGSTLIHLLHSKGCVGILLNVGQTFFFPFYCMGNEAALSISSRASRPRVFAGLDSSRGVHAWSVYAAAKFPMEVLVNCVECQFMLPSYISSMFLFTSTWVEPMYGYATLLLAAAGLASYIACGSDGIQVEAGAPDAEHQHQPALGHSSSFDSSVQGVDLTV